MIGRTELAKVIAETTGCGGNKAEECVGAIVETISASIANGEDVQLRGLGSFSRESTAAREARNPQTGAPIQVPAGYRIKFKAGKKLRDRMPAA